jgi:putative transposase
MTDWPHAPVHRLSEVGAYMVTVGTYRKEHFLSGPERLTLVRDTLFACANEFDWHLQAWAVMSNHYHFVAVSPANAGSLRRLIGKLHMTTAKALNEMDGRPGRKIWHQYWDSHITYQPSYLARLQYVHHNPVHHGVALNAGDYEWCSAAWFARTAKPAFVKTVASFKTDRLNVLDDFAPRLRRAVGKSDDTFSHSKGYLP